MISNPDDAILNAVYNDALEWAANWITGAQLLGHSDETVQYAKTMAMSIRAAKKPVNFQADFFDDVRNDPYMSVSDKEYWLSQENISMMPKADKEPMTNPPQETENRKEN